MKKIAYLLVLLISISGCSVDSIESEENLRIADAKPSLEVEAAVTEEFNYDELICAGESFTFCMTFPQAKAGPNNKDTQVMLQLKKYGDDPETEEIEGEDHEYYEPISKGQGGTSYCDEWTFEEAKTYEVRYKIGSGGFTEESIVVENCTACEESFSYTDYGDGSYTFYYTPAEDMEDALIVFTFAQSVLVNGPEDWENNGQTEQLIMDLEECVTYDWKVYLEKNCSGNSQNSNVWTDFKVNDISKKNESTPNITQSCD